MAKNAKQQAAIAMSMKASGKKPKMAKGGNAGALFIRMAKEFRTLCGKSKE